MVLWLPTINAFLNGIAFVLLVTGWFMIRNRQIAAHRACMIGAFVVSSLFLACYLTYHALIQGSRPFLGTGIWRPIYYYVILIPHIILAIVMLPFILATFYRAFRERFDLHKQIARPTLVMWLYVSLTGVLVYWMLYRIDWS